MVAWPFNPAADRNTWSLIEADGFSAPVPGCIYDGDRLDGGVPLGGLGTGYFTLEGNGQIGLCSIYNDIVPPRACYQDWLTLRVNQRDLPLSSAEIAYWGHYPVADLVAQFAEAPLQVGIRAFSPLIVGHATDSNIPAVLFELAVTNQGTAALSVELAITPPPPTKGKGQVTLLGDLSTGAAGSEPLKGSVTLSLAPGEVQRVRFVFAWYVPDWRDSGGEAHIHQYSRRYPDVAHVAQDVLERFDLLLKRILAWQREVYQADLPAWLRDALIQGLYSLAKNTIWIAKTRKDEWWGDNGWFTHSESHTGCPITETMVCRMHGHFPALFFFPELETSTLDAFRHFQISDGEIPFSYGMKTSMRDPRYHCQHPLNPGQYAQMIYRLYQRTGDKALLQRFYDSAKRAITYGYTLDDDDDGLVNDQAHVAPGELWPANQFYDIWPWYGTSAYVAGTWLATLACGRAMAEAVGDAAFVKECDQWLVRGQAAYQAKLWTGTYYRLWNDTGNDSGKGQVNDVSLGNQLMAQWCVRLVGLPDLLPEAQVQSALNTVARLNMAATPYGLVNGVTPSGERYDSKAEVGHNDHGEILAENDHAKQTFIAENLCAAMTFMFHGQTATGLEIAKRLYEALALKSRAPWNQRCLINAASGLPIWGDDYYSNMVIWAVPMALARQSIHEFVDSGGLIARMISAGA